MNNEQLLECLSILQEECAEVIVVISKIRRFGLDTEYVGGDGTKRTALTQEIADVLCLIEKLVKHKIVNETALEGAFLKKKEKLKKFSNIGYL
jgi:NTP pyrophosphatase (non-canonical NTP hydrolase)